MIAAEASQPSTTICAERADGDDRTQRRSPESLRSFTSERRRRCDCRCRPRKRSRRVQAIGAGATNQAVKAVAIARDYLRETGIEAVCLPAFIDVTIDNEDRTAIRLVVEPR